MNKSCITYHLDKENKIIFLSDEWQSFADENKGSHLTEDFVLNKSIFEFITNGRCKRIYQILIDRSKEVQGTLKFPFRCDSPEKRRFMSMEIFPIKGESTGFKSCVVREEIREPVLLLDKGIDRSDEFLTICSWCKKIRVDEYNWVEVEEAIEKLGLFGERSLPQLSHGMCSVCYNNARKEFI